MAKAISDDARKRISKKVGAAADLTCRDHLGGITQEPAINVAIGEAVARALDGLVYDGYEIKALSQPIPDRGRGSMEGWLGADIYVGIRVIKNRHTYLSKGFLVQAKLDGDRGRAASRQLPNQIEQMKSHTKAAYVWVYTLTTTGGHFRAHFRHAQLYRRGPKNRPPKRADDPTSCRCDA